MKVWVIVDKKGKPYKEHGAFNVYDEEAQGLSAIWAMGKGGYVSIKRMELIEEV